MPFTRGSSQPRVRTQDTWFAGGFFTVWVTREASDFTSFICKYCVYTAVWNSYHTCRLMCVCSVAEWCLTLCNPWDFSRQGYWSGLPCPPPGNLPNLGIQPRSPALQADSLPSKPPGKPRNSGVVAYPFSRGSSWLRNRTGVSCLAGRFFTI